MYRNGFVLVIIGSIICFLYGLYNVRIEVEPNACRMTYMFEQPMYSRVRMKHNEAFPHYQLFYYYEGYQNMNVNKMKLTGAPVIFVPGNGGSYKQVRSLASVALRKGMHNKRGLHLDYFTVDYDEELSALYGGYLHMQHEFLKRAIHAVLRLYHGSSKVVLIGHSMGGKVAQSVLIAPQVAKYISTIITISSPMDEPVLNLDPNINEVYLSVDEQLSKIRSSYQPNNETNVCCYNRVEHIQLAKQPVDISKRLDNILLITTGGGNRDLLVRAPLTISKFSDVHALTSSIPTVGVSCDHLSAVWCLQFMLVINRFLFSITLKHDNGYVVFNDEKSHNLNKALHFFVQLRPKPHKLTQKPRFSGKFNFEQRKLVFNKRFDALQTEYNQFVNIVRTTKFKRLFVEIIKHDNDNDWLFACNAATDETGNGKAYCDRNSSLAQHVNYLTATGMQAERIYAELDLNKLQKSHGNVSHVLVQLPPTYKQIGFNIDIYDPEQRTIVIKFPLWYSMSPRVIINETMQDTIHYKLKFVGLIEPFQAVHIMIEPRACIRTEFQVTTRLCIPWAEGFDTTLTINATNYKRGLYVNVPLGTPRHYNTTENPVELDIFLDPACRFSIRYQYSLVDAMSRLVRDFYGWLPANIVAVLIIVLRTQIGRHEQQGTLKSLRPYTGYFQHTSLFVVTACRLLKKVLYIFKQFPQPEHLNYAIHISIIIHSMTIAISIVSAFVVWWVLVFNGEIIHKIALRFIKLTQVWTSILTTTIMHLPLTFGLLTISIAFSTCSGVALTFASVIYFFMLSNAYKDYLEDLLWRKAVSVLKAASKRLNTSQSTTKTTMPTSAVAVDESAALNEGNEEKMSPLAANADADEQKIVADILQNAEDTHLPPTCTGLQNFPYHMTVFLLLCVYTALNGTSTLAWVRSKRIGVNLPDPVILPTVFLLASLTILLQINAPNKVGAYRFMSVLLYMCGAFCVMYCQVAIFRLYYVISFCFVLLALHETLIATFNLYAN